MIETVVTMVHGTFARGAPWTAADSKLSTGLRDRLVTPLRIEPFLWSGRNRFVDRHEATARLAEHIETVAARSPGAHQVIIAHSHGGNIVAQLPKRAFDRVAGAICLSTPFIFLQRRNDPHAASIGLIANIILGLLIAETVLRRLMHLAMPHPLTFNFFATTEITGAMSANFHYLVANGLLPKVAIVDLVCCLILVAVHRGWYGFADRRASMLDALHTTDVRLPANRTLIIRTVGDEASFVIAVSHFLQRSIFALNQIVQVAFLALAYIAVQGLATILERSEALVSVLVLVAGCLVIGFFVSLLWQGEGVLMAAFFAILFAVYWTIIAVMYVLVLAVFGSFLAICASAVAFWPITIIASVLSLALGRELALSVPLVEASAEATPPGLFGIVQLSYAQTDVTPDGLRHSAGYASDATIDVIVRWLSGKLGCGIR